MLNVDTSASSVELLDDEVCDATEDDSSTAAGYKIIAPKSVRKDNFQQAISRCFAVLLITVIFV